MIWNALIDIVLSAVTWLLSLLPAYTPGEGGASEALRLVVSSIRAAGNWFSLPALFGVLALWVTIEGALMVTKAAQWVYAKIPGKAT